MRSDGRRHGVLPWLCVVGEVDLQSPTRWSFIAALPSILAIRAARDTAPPPRRLDMLRALPHRSVAIGPRRHRSSFVQLKGGAGVLLRLFDRAPCTRVGLDNERKTRSTRVDARMACRSGVAPLCDHRDYSYRVFFHHSARRPQLIVRLQAHNLQARSEPARLLFIAAPCTTPAGTRSRRPRNGGKNSGAQLPDRPVR